jgi:hypothetical protein
MLSYMGILFWMDILNVHNSFFGGIQFFVSVCWRYMGKYIQKLNNDQDI